MISSFQMGFRPALCRILVDRFIAGSIHTTAYTLFLLNLLRFFKSSAPITVTSNSVLAIAKILQKLPKPKTHLPQNSTPFTQNFSNGQTHNPVIHKSPIHQNPPLRNSNPFDQNFPNATTSTPTTPWPTKPKNRPPKIPQTPKSSVKNSENAKTHNVKAQPLPNHPKPNSPNLRTLLRSNLLKCQTPQMQSPTNPSSVNSPATLTSILVKDERIPRQAPIAHSRAVLVESCLHLTLTTCKLHGNCGIFQVDLRKGSWRRLGCGLLRCEYE